MKDDLTHTRSCNVWDIEQGCTCCLKERRRITELEAALGTEQTMHAAWRKRAEEAESALRRPTPPMSRRRTTSKETRNVSKDDETSKPADVAGRIDGLVMPEKYTSVSCGVATRANGNLLLVDDVARLIDSILDDDEMVAIELSRFLRYLRA